MLINRLLQLQH